MANALHSELRTPMTLRHNPCALVTFMATKDFMNGGPALPWWHFTPVRKATLQGLIEPTHLLCESVT